MKKILATLLMIPLVAFSQNEKPVVKGNLEIDCFSYSTFASFIKEFEEQAFLVMTSGRDTKSGVAYVSAVLFVNTKTKTWTFVEKVEDLYCVVATGSEIRPFEVKDRKFY